MRGPLKIMYSSTANIQNEREVSLADILAEGFQLWGKAKKAIRGPNPDIQAVSAALYREHKEFCTSYPVVFNSMVALGRYSHKAFHRHLKRIAAKPWRSTAEYFEAQADYSADLYMVYTPHWKRVDVARLREDVRASLEAQHDDILKQAKESEASVEDKLARLAAESKAELATYLSSNSLPVRGVDMEFEVSQPNPAVTAGLNPRQLTAATSALTGGPEGSAVARLPVRASDLFSG